MDTLGIIVARKGSKGLPGKHLRLLRGKPVIDYSFEHALESMSLTRIIVSTNDEGVKERAVRFGLAIHHRSENLSEDTTPLQPVLLDVIQALSATEGYMPQSIAIIQGNIPVRKKGITDLAIERFYCTDFDCFRTFSPVGKYHPQFAWTIDDEGRTTRLMPNAAHRRQDTPPVFFPDSAAFILKTRVISEWETIRDPLYWGKNRGGLIQDAYSTFEIDEPVDMFFAEALLDYYDKRNQ